MFYKIKIAKETILATVALIIACLSLTVVLMRPKYEHFTDWVQTSYSSPNEIPLEVSLTALDEIVLEAGRTYLLLDASSRKLQFWTKENSSQKNFQMVAEITAEGDLNLAGVLKEKALAPKY